jgi:hypothetical protein
MGIKKKLMLSAIDPANSTSSCITVPTIRRKLSIPRSLVLVPPISTSPSVAERIPSITLISVVFPQPDGPAIAIDSLAAIFRLIPSNIKGSCSA